MIGFVVTSRSHFFLVEQDCAVTSGDRVEPVMESRVVGNTSTFPEDR